MDGCLYEESVTRRRGAPIKGKEGHRLRNGGQCKTPTIHVPHRVKQNVKLHATAVCIVTAHVAEVLSTYRRKLDGDK